MRLENAEFSISPVMLQKKEILKVSYLSFCYFCLFVTIGHFQIFVPVLLCRAGRMCHTTSRKIKSCSSG